MSGSAYRRSSASLGPIGQKHLQDRSKTVVPNEHILNYNDVWTPDKKTPNEEEMTMGGRFQHRHRGFTLVEILVVVIIIGVMASLAVPGIRALLPAYHLRSAAHELVSLMQLARMKAAATGHHCYVVFQPGGFGNVYTCFLDRNDNGTGDFEKEGASGPAYVGNEYRLGSATFNDVAAGIPVIRLPAGITFGSSATRPIPGAASVPDDGITFNGKPPRLVFYPSGRGKLGTVYLQNEKGAGYAISVSIVGRIFVRKWDRENKTWVAR